MQQVRTHAAILVQLVLFRVVFQFGLLFFEGLYKEIDSLLQLLFVSGHKKMIKPNTGISPNSILDGRPVAISLLIGHAQEHDVRLLAEVLGLLRVVDHHLFHRPLISINLLLDESGRLLFEAVHAVSSLKVSLDLIIIIKRVHLLEENVQVALNFFDRLRPYMLRYLRGHLTRVHLERLDELLEVSSIPIKEALLE